MRSLHFIGTAKVAIFSIFEKIFPFKTYSDRTARISRSSFLMGLFHLMALWMGT